MLRVNALKIILFILLSLHIHLIASYQIVYPTIQLLRGIGIVSLNSQKFNYHSQFPRSQLNEEQRGQNTTKIEQSEQMNEQFSKKIRLIFQMFIYPFRVYSFFDQGNTKQYIFKKISIKQFKQNSKGINNQNSQKTQGHNYNASEESILQSEFNVQKCLFKVQQEYQKLLYNQPYSQQIKNPQLTQLQCLKPNQLYQLIPDYLFLVLQKHEQLTLQKVNQQYILIKNHIIPDSKPDVKYFVSFDLHRIDIHSYLYEARLAFMKYLLDQKNSQRKNTIINRQKDNYDPITKEWVTKDNVKTNQQILKSQQVSQIQNQKFYTITTKKFFSKIQQIWYEVFQRNSEILSNLFTYEKSIFLRNQAKFDYIASKDIFYLVEANQYECPMMTKDVENWMFSFQSEQQNGKLFKKRIQEKLCTFLTIHKILFVQFQSSQPIQHHTDDGYLRNIKSLSLGIAEGDQYHRKQAKLFINIITDKMSIQIEYGNSWKQIRSQYLSYEVEINQINGKSQQSSDQSKQPSQQEMELSKRIFYLKDLRKVEIDSKSLQINQFKQFGDKIVKTSQNKFIKICQLKLQPFVLTVQKLNNQLIVVCVEGSKCMIIDKDCKIKNVIQFNNAFGIQWQYKLNYLGYSNNQHKIQSYVTAIKPSQNIYRSIPVDIDVSMLKQNKILRTGDFHQKYQFSRFPQVQNNSILSDKTNSAQIDIKQQADDFIPFLFEAKEIIITSQVTYSASAMPQNHRIRTEIFPKFDIIEIPYKYYPKQLFPDSIYASFAKFKQRFTDTQLHDYLLQKFNVFYFPKFNNNSKSSLLQNSQQQFQTEQNTIQRRKSQKIQKEKLLLVNFNNGGKFQALFRHECDYRKLQNYIHFDADWNMCKIILKTESLFVLDPFQTEKHNQKQLNDAQSQSSQLKEFEKIVNASTINKQQLQNTHYLSSIPTIQATNNESAAKSNENDDKKGLKQTIEIYSNQNIEETSNLIVVCSMYKNSRPYTKCKINDFQMTKSFYQNKRKAKFFLQAGRYFQIYFFNRKFLTATKNQSFLQLLEDLAHQTYAQRYRLELNSKTQTSKNQAETQIKQVGKQKQFQNYKDRSQLNQIKIVIEKRVSEQDPTKQQHTDIYLRDYEKQQMQSLSKILLISYCIFFPTILICCCIVCFKNYLQNILIYYGVIRVQPSFRYPLSKIALKIKLKELKKDGYAKIHKNKRKHDHNEKLDQNNSDTMTDIKFSFQCCFCLEQLKYDEEVVELYCRHEFHSECFIEWVKNQPNTKCPLCKRTFTKSALKLFKQSSIIKESPKKQVQHYSDQNQLESSAESNQIQMIQYQS